MTSPTVIEDNQVFLRCTKCIACGNTMFPPQSYGCDVCGASGGGFSEIRLRASGRIVAAVEVRVHPTRSVPFTVGMVRLDESDLVVSAPIVSADAPEPGTCVSGRIQAKEQSVEFCFAPEEVSRG